MHGTMQTRYKMTMGLEPLDPDELIEIDEHYEAEIALRRQMLADMRDVVLQTSEKAWLSFLHPYFRAPHALMPQAAAIMPILVLDSDVSPS